MSGTADGRFVGFTADIVTAYLSHNPVDAAELPALIQRVHEGLRAAAAPTQPTEGSLEPAVPIKRSVFPDAVVCLDCGGRLATLKRHLMAEHGLSPEEYRLRWRLPDAYPLVAPNYTQRRSALAKEAGLGRRTEAEASPKMQGVVIQRIPENRRGRPRKGAISS